MITHIRVKVNEAETLVIPVAEYKSLGVIYKVVGYEFDGTNPLILEEIPGYYQKPIGKLSGAGVGLRKDLFEWMQLDKWDFNVHSNPEVIMFIQADTRNSGASHIKDSSAVVIPNIPNPNPSVTIEADGQTSGDESPVQRFGRVIFHHVSGNTHDAWKRNNTEKNDLKPDGFITTKSGIKLELLNPKPEMIYLSDIASGLANKGHFGGQTPGYFSIAEHSMMVYWLALSGEDTSPRRLLAALMHDAAEAYIGDMVKPLKVMIPLFGEIEKKIETAIFQRFCVPMSHLPEVKPFDIVSQQIEYNAFYRNIHHPIIKYWPPEEAGEKFYNLAESLIAKIWSEHE